jgi:hypothetical protein
MSALLNALAVLALSPLLLASPPAGPAEAAAMEYLRGKYDKAIRRPNQTEITGLAYMPEEAPLYPLRTPLLRRLMPDTTFFTTTIFNPSMEYLHVETLVSVRSSSQGFDVRSTLSPVFTDTSPTFLEQFSGLSANSAAERSALTRAIADLLVRVTYKGALRELSCGTNTCTVQLWHGKLHWRDISVSFAPTSKVTGVLVFRQAN